MLQQSSPAPMAEESMAEPTSHLLLQEMNLHVQRHPWTRLGAFQDRRTTNACQVPDQEVQLNWTCSNNNALQLLAMLPQPVVQARQQHRSFFLRKMSQHLHEPVTPYNGATAFTSCASSYSGIGCDITRVIRPSTKPS